MTTLYSTCGEQPVDLPGGHRRENRQQSVGQAGRYGTGRIATRAAAVTRLWVLPDLQFRGGALPGGVSAGPAGFRRAGRGHHTVRQAKLAHRVMTLLRKGT
jgi:hypothetical protein